MLKSYRVVVAWVVSNKILETAQSPNSSKNINHTYFRITNKWIRGKPQELSFMQEREQWVCPSATLEPNLLQ